MTKKDLRTGMVLTCKNGDHYLYIKDYPNYRDGVAINLDNNKGALDIASHNDDLTRVTLLSGDAFTVVKIEESKSPCDIRRCFTNESTRYETIWTREPKTFKVVCVDNDGYRFYTIGKIYEVKNGTMIDDEGCACFGNQIKSFDHLVSMSTAEWVKVVE